MSRGIRQPIKLSRLAVILVLGAAIVLDTVGASSGASLARRGNGHDLPHSLAISPDGTKVFVTGDSDGGLETNLDYATIAYQAATGKKLWIARYDGPASRDDGGEALRVSGDGTRVYVTGGTVGKKSGYDFGTFAYNASTGKRLWMARYDGPRSGDDGGERLVVAGSPARVFVTGSSWGGKAKGWDYATIAYDAATGKRFWVARYDGANNTEEWASLAASPDGSTVFVSGGSARRDTEFDYVVIAYNSSTGAQRWVARYDGPVHGFDEATSLAVSLDGRKVFVSGYSEDATACEDAVVIAYDAATGSQLWINRYSGAEETDARVSSLRVNLDGTKLFATGFTDDGEADGDYVTIAYNTLTGARQWVARYDGPAKGYEWSHSLALSPDGKRVFVNGESESRQRGYTQDYATVAYDAESGKELWVRRYDGPARDNDWGGSLGVNPDGTRVYVTGYSFGKTTRTDYATLAYDSATGQRTWLARYNGPGILCIVPYVQELPLRTAKASLRQEDCAAGKVSRVRSSVKKGLVVGQDPMPRTRLPSKSPVRLYVSRGPN